MLNPDSRPAFDFVIEFNRFMIMIALCIYYIYKASKVLPKWKEYIKYIMIWTIGCSLVYLGLGINIFILWMNGDEKICVSHWFTYIRICNISSVIIFAALYYRLHVNVKAQKIVGKQG